MVGNERNSNFPPLTPNVIVHQLDGNSQTVGAESSENMNAHFDDQDVDFFDCSGDQGLNSSDSIEPSANFRSVGTDYNNNNSDGNVNGHTRPNGDVVVVVIKPTESADIEESSKLLYNSKHRLNVLRESSFWDYHDAIREIKLNREKKHLVVVLDAKVPKEALERMYGVIMLGGCDVECRGPRRQNIENGVVVGYPHLTELNVLERTFEEKGIKYRYVKRLSRYVNNVRTPADNVLVGFEESIPNHVTIDYCRYNIRPFEERPTRCFKCQRFGHTIKNCKMNGDKCDKCGENHNSRDCKIDIRKESINVKCANCGQNHPAFSKRCERYKLAVEVKKVQVDKKISYSKALREVKKHESVGATVPEGAGLMGLGTARSVPGNNASAARTLRKVPGSLTGTRVNGGVANGIDGSTKTCKDMSTQTENETASQTGMDCEDFGSLGSTVIDKMANDGETLRKLLSDCLVPAVALIPRELISAWIYDILVTCLAHNGRPVKNAKNAIGNTILRLQDKVARHLEGCKPRPKRKFTSSDSLAGSTEGGDDVNVSTTNNAAKPGTGKKTKQNDG